MPLPFAPAGEERLARIASDAIAVALRLDRGTFRRSADDVARMRRLVEMLGSTLPLMRAEDVLLQLIAQAMLAAHRIAAINDAHEASLLG